MEIEIFKRKVFPTGEYLFYANNLNWAYKNKEKLEGSNAQWWITIDDKENITELVSCLRESVEKIFGKGKHLTFLFSLEKGKSIQLPFNDYFLATSEEITDWEFQDFLEKVLQEFQDWEN